MFSKKNFLTGIAGKDDIGDDIYTLPNELLVQIAGYVGRVHGLKLRRVCRRLCSIVTPIVFRKINEPLEALGALKSLEYTKHLRILDGRKLNHDVASSMMRPWEELRHNVASDVIGLCKELHHNVLHSFSAPHLSSNQLRLLSETQRELRCLTLNDQRQCHEPLQVEPFSRLDTFSLCIAHHHYQESLLEACQHWRFFLDQHPQIEHLGIHFSVDMSNDEFTPFQEPLERLLTPPAGETRKLKSLQLRDVYISQPQSFPFDRIDFSSLQRLWLSQSNLAEELLGYLGSRPSLVIREFSYVWTYDTDDGPAPKNHTFDNMSSFLGSFVGLERIDIYNGWDSGLPKLDSVLHHHKTLRHLSIMCCPAFPKIPNSDMTYSLDNVEDLKKKCLRIEFLSLPLPQLMLISYEDQEREITAESDFIKAMDILKTSTTLRCLCIANKPSMESDWGESLREDPLAPMSPTILLIRKAYEDVLRRLAERILGSSIRRLMFGTPKEKIWTEPDDYSTTWRDMRGGDFRSKITRLYPTTFLLKNGREIVQEQVEDRGVREKEWDKRVEEGLPLRFFDDVHEKDSLSL